MNTIVRRNGLVPQSSGSVWELYPGRQSLSVAPWFVPPPQKKWGKGLKGRESLGFEQSWAVCFMVLNHGNTTSRGGKGVIIINLGLVGNMGALAGKEVICGQIKGFTPHSWRTMNTGEIWLPIILAIITPGPYGGRIWCLHLLAAIILDFSFISVFCLSNTLLVNLSVCCQCWERSLTQYKY